MHHFIRAYRQFADFEGRATRAEYWWFVLIFFVISFVLRMAEDMLGLVRQPDEYGYLTIVFYVVSLVPYIAATTRRLHDADSSGWWQLIGFVPLLGGLFLIYMLVRRGSEEENAYGPPVVEAA
jgi:uncharacterized membrane protein YhaH (DUF805 family)